MTKTVIGFLGRAGAGKTTAANYFVQEHGATKISLALPLKLIAQDVFDFTDDQVFGDQRTKEEPDYFWGVSPREMLQRLGVAVREHLNVNIWLDAALASIRESDAELFVIDDVRFINEVSTLKSADDLNVKIVKLTCSDFKTNADSSHPSEAEVDRVPEQLIDENIVAKWSSNGFQLLSKIQEACLI